MLCKNPMLCKFEVFETLPDGRRRGKCVRCGQVSGPTPYEVASINAVCHRAAQVCVHLGGETGNLIKCLPCKNNTRLKTFACSVFGECTTTTPAKGLACCDSGRCDRFVARGIIGGKPAKRFDEHNLAPGES